MNIQKNGEFSFWGSNARVQESKELPQIKDVIKKLQGHEITIGNIPETAATLEISKEGRLESESLHALRKAVQEMPDSGALDYEEMMRMREILPKLQMDPMGSHYNDMYDMKQASLNQIKTEKKTYNLEDVVGSWMKSYALQYDKLTKAYKDGTRDAYIQDGMDEEGNFIYHQITKEEDIDYLNQAFAKVANGTGMLAELQQERWEVRHIFAGEEELGISLPENYADTIKNVMETARSEFVMRYNAGAYNNTDSMISDAESIGSKYLKADNSFWSSMARLFSGMKVNDYENYHI